MQIEETCTFLLYNVIFALEYPRPFYPHIIQKRTPRSHLVNLNVDD